ncbi:MAG: Glu-tRNA(Gln) amidotransferase GatDE subunit E, partial [Haloplanus sp.]
EVEALRDAVDAGPNDAVAIVADNPETANLAIDAVADRAETAIEGVPEETRDATQEGTTRYLRPLPGAARMYPETDVPPVELDPTDVELPELLTEKVDRYRRAYDLNAGLAEQVAYGRRMPLFESVVEAGVDATFAAGVLEGTLTELRRDDVPVDALTDDHLRSILLLVEDGDLAKEGVDEVLTVLAETPSLTAEAAIEKAGLAGVSETEVRNAVADVVERNADQVESEGMGAFSALMGECMGALRGKADGEIVSDVLREEIGKRT